VKKKSKLNKRMPHALQKMKFTLRVFNMEREIAGLKPLTWEEYETLPKARKQGFNS